MGTFQKFIAFYTIVYREWIRSFRVWAGTILPPIVTTILYFVIFGHVIGNRVGTMDGYAYFQFIAPGLIMMGVITNAYSATSSGFFSLKFSRDIEEILITPMPAWILLTGFMVSGMVRGILIGIVIAIIALFFSQLFVHSLAIIIIVTLLASAIFAVAGVLNAIYAKTFDDITLIPTFVLAPLTYLSGVFYSSNLLPPFWRHISMANPIMYIIRTFRYGVLGTPTYQLSISLSVMGVVLIVLFITALFLIKRSPRIRMY